MSAKFAASGLLKIKVVLEKSYDVITHVHVHFYKNFTKKQKCFLKDDLGSSLIIWD